MDRFRRAYEDMLRDGADPRRAAPASARGHMVQIVKTAPWWIVFAVGCLVPTLIFLAATTAFDLRIASSADIRLAGIVRGSIPNADGVGTDVIAARLALPVAAAQVVARLLTTPRPVPGWIGRLAGKTPIFVDPGRLEALRAILLRLRTLDDDDRSRWLDRLEELDRVARDPKASAILAAVASLPASARSALSADNSYGALLEQIAETDPQRRATLLGFGLSNLPERPARLAIITRMTRLNDDSFRVLRTWLESDDYQRNAAVIWSLGQLESGNKDIWAVLTALYARDDRLVALMPRLRAYCEMGSRRYCP